MVCFFIILKIVSNTIQSVCLTGLIFYYWIMFNFHNIFTNTRDNNNNNKNR